MYSKSLFTARHQTIGTGFRAMWATSTVENGLYPLVTVLGRFSLLDGPQIQEMRNSYDVLHSM